MDAPTVKAEITDRPLWLFASGVDQFLTQNIDDLNSKSRPMDARMTAQALVGGHANILPRFHLVRPD